MKASITTQPLHYTTFETPIGDMLAIANDHALYAMKFIEKPDISVAIKQYQLLFQKMITPGKNTITRQITDEMQHYFSGKIKRFTTPIELTGTSFQKNVWRALLKIPFGKTYSYRELAERIKHPTAYRAVANANGKNLFTIMIPCHRVINHNGQLGGYAGGLDRKQWLLDHEASKERFRL